MRKIDYPRVSLCAVFLYLSLSIVFVQSAWAGGCYYDVAIKLGESQELTGSAFTSGCTSNSSYSGQVTINNTVSSYEGSVQIEVGQDDKITSIALEVFHAMAGDSYEVVVEGPNKRMWIAHKDANGKYDKRLGAKHAIFSEDPTDPQLTLIRRGLEFDKEIPYEPPLIMFDPIAVPSSPLGN